MPFDEWKEGDPLPNADQALIDERRFMEYVLNPEHPGHAHKNKWMAFEEIGYDVHTPDGRRKATEDITRQLVRQLNGAIAVPARTSDYGPRFEVEMPIAGPNGKWLTLRTIWQYDQGSIVPRLITLIPKA